MRYTKQLITVSLLMGLSLNSCTNDDNSVPSQQTPTVILFSASPTGWNRKRYIPSLPCRPTCRLGYTDGAIS